MTRTSDDNRLRCVAVPLLSSAVVLIILELVDRLVSANMRELVDVTTDVLGSLVFPAAAWWVLVRIYGTARAVPRPKRTVVVLMLVFVLLGDVVIVLLYSAAESAI